MGAPVGRNGANVIFDPELLKNILNEKVDKVIDDAKPGIKDAANELAVNGVEHVAEKVKDLAKEKVAEHVPMLGVPIANRSIDATHRYSVDKMKNNIPPLVDKSADISVRNAKAGAHKVTGKSVDAVDLSVRMLGRDNN